MKKCKDKVGKDNKVTLVTTINLFSTVTIISLLYICLEKGSLGSPGPSQTHVNPPASDS